MYIKTCNNKIHSRTTTIGGYQRLSKTKGETELNTRIIPQQKNSSTSENEYNTLQRGFLYIFQFLLNTLR